MKPLFWLFGCVYVLLLLNIVVTVYCVWKSFDNTGLNDPSGFLNSSLLEFDETYKHHLDQATFGVNPDLSKFHYLI